MRLSALSAAFLAKLSGKNITAEIANEGRRENLRSTASFIILSCDPYYGRFRTTPKEGEAGSENVYSMPIGVR